MSIIIIINRKKISVEKTDNFLDTNYNKHKPCVLMREKRCGTIVLQIQNFSFGK